MTERSRRLGLKWKITSTFVAMMVLSGILVVGIVYYLTGQALREQLDQRAYSIATNLSDAVAGHVLGKNLLELHALTTKYARLDGVAYVFLENAKGEVLAHSLASFPAELKEEGVTDRRQPRRRMVNLKDRAVYETRVPILEGQVGVARVGIWGDVVEGEIYRAVIPLIGLIAIVLFVGLIVSVSLARSIIRPILGLTRVADKISKGDFSTPVGVQSRDEIGELARSLERMRSSLRAAMMRLSREET